MEPIQLKQDLKHLSIEARHQTKLQFFRLYEKYGNVAKCARDLGIASSTATVWVRKYKANGKKVVKENRHGRKKGDGRTLSEQQEKELLGMIVDKTPLQYKFKFALWNAKAIKQLIQYKFGIDMPARTVRSYMQRNGFTPQRPEKRAREQKPEKVNKWLTRNYPRIRKAANKEKAEIYWCDETGVSTRENYQRGYAPKGKTPILEVTSVVSCRISMISAVNNQGRLCFHAYSGGLTILKFLRFAKAVIHDSTSKKVVLIVDNLRIHHAKIVRAWAARHRDEIKIFYLPAYSPELNPDELVNGDLKLGVGQREPAANKEELRMQIVDHMEETKRNPEKVKNFFRKASVRYASDNNDLLPEQ